MIFYFAIVALTLVCLRGAQTQSAARTLRLEARRTELRSELWSLETRAARLRAPRQIRERVDVLDAAVMAPDDKARWRSPARLAADRGYD